MALLIVLETREGDWQTFVLSRQTAVNFVGDADVLGRKVPSGYRRLRAWDGVVRSDAERLAKALNGAAKRDRLTAALKAAEGLRLHSSAGPWP